MRNVVIVMLILVIFGLWFYTETTKDVIKTAGLATKEIGEDVGQKIVDSAEEGLEEKNISKELKDLLNS